MKKPHHLLILTTLLIINSTCHAQNQDGVKWRAGLSYSDDNNFLRSSNSPASETITDELFGVNLSLPFGLQRLELDANLAASQHKNYTNFDYTGQNYNAVFRYSITPGFHGNISSVRTERLNSAADSVNPDLRNKNTSLSNSIDAAYELGGKWSLTTGLESTRSINERDLAAQTDNKVSSGRFGVRYSAATGSHLGYAYYVGNGDSGGDYKISGHEINGTVQLTQEAALSGSLRNFLQQFDGLSQYDFNGTSGQLNLSWRPTGKIAATVGWQRDAFSYVLPGGATSGVVYARTDTTSIGPIWNISPKTSVRLLYQYALREDVGGATNLTPPRKDESQNTVLTISWQPRTFVVLTASLTDAKRTSSVINQDYVARIVGLTGQLTF